MKKNNTPPTPAPTPTPAPIFSFTPTPAPNNIFLDKYSPTCSGMFGNNK